MSVVPAYCLRLLRDITTPRYMFDERGEETIPHREWLQEYDRIMNEVKAELKAQNREDEFIGSKVRASPKTRPFRSRLLDYLLCSTLHHPRGVGMASRGLYRPETRVSALDRRYDSVLTLDSLAKALFKVLISSDTKTPYVPSSTTLNHSPSLQAAWKNLDLIYHSSFTQARL